MVWGELSHALLHESHLCQAEPDEVENPDR